MSGSLEIIFVCFFEDYKLLFLALLNNINYNLFSIFIF